MKKGLFNAPFEKSKQLVDDSYIEYALEYTSIKWINRRLIGIFLLNGVLILTNLILIAVDYEFTQDSLSTLTGFSSFSFLWFLVATIVHIYYLVRNIQSRKKRMLNEYYTDQVMNLILLFYNSNISCTIILFCIFNRHNIIILDLSFIRFALYN